jgi:hypothetical protein
VRGRRLKWVIFDPDQAGSKSRHVGCAPESGSKIRALFMTGGCGSLVLPGV